MCPLDGGRRLTLQRLRARQEQTLTAKRPYRRSALEGWYRWALDYANEFEDGGAVLVDARFRRLIRGNTFCLDQWPSAMCYRMLSRFSICQG